MRLDFWPEGIEKSASVTRRIGISLVANVLADELDIAAAYFPVEIQPAMNDYLTQSQKREYAKLVGSVLSMVDSLGYSIESYGQAMGTYSYYIRFVPCDWNGELIDELVEVTFRVSQHDPNGGTNFSYNPSMKTLFANFQLDNVGDYEEASQLLDSVRNVLERMKSGDFSAAD